VSQSDIKSVCVFAGSSPGSRPEYRQHATELGRALAARGIGVVYGGTRVGLMGAVADAVLASGFIALPGGWGMWEEFFEILTWGQLGLHRKPCGLLNVEGNGLGPPEGLLDKLASYDAPSIEKWIDRGST
jgi:predicted Rossmann-fold nucleotide-binding protein